MEVFPVKQMKGLIFLFALLIPVFATGKVLLYVSGPEKMIGQVEAAFEAERGDVLEVFHTGSGPLMQKVWMEMTVGSIQADLVWGGEPMMYFSLAEKGFLQTYYPDDYDQLLEEYQYGDGFFTPVNSRFGTLICNPETVDPAAFPASWEDLRDPRWAGKVAIADPSQSAMAFALMASLYSLPGGRQIIESLGENGVFLAKQNIDAISMVQSGEMDLCFAPHDGAFRLMKQASQKGLNTPLQILWPREGVFSVQRPIAIIQKARDEREEQWVKEFVDFAFSVRGQQIAASFGFASVRKDLERIPGVPGGIKVLYTDWKQVWQQQSSLLDFFSSNVLEK